MLTCQAPSGIGVGVRDATKTPDQPKFSYDQLLQQVKEKDAEIEKLKTCNSEFKRKDAESLDTIKRLQRETNVLKIQKKDAELKNAKLVEAQIKIINRIGESIGENPPPLCSICHEPMTGDAEGEDMSPVMTMDSQVYHQKCIQQYFQILRDQGTVLKDPLTNLPLSSDALLVVPFWSELRQAYEDKQTLQTFDTEFANVDSALRKQIDRVQSWKVDEIAAVHAKLATAHAKVENLHTELATASSFIAVFVVDKLQKEWDEMRSKLAPMREKRADLVRRIVDAQELPRLLDEQERAQLQRDEQELAKLKLTMDRLHDEWTRTAKVFLNVPAGQICNEIQQLLENIFATLQADKCQAEEKLDEFQMRQLRWTLGQDRFWSNPEFEKHRRISTTPVRNLRNTSEKHRRISTRSTSTPVTNLRNTSEDIDKINFNKRRIDISAQERLRYQNSHSTCYPDFKVQDDAKSHAYKVAAKFSRDFLEKSKTKSHSN